MRKLCCVVGARPNYMKIAPILRAIEKHGDTIGAVLVHTGQHYDKLMNETFFTELGIPSPDVHLEVGSKSHAVQTAEIMTRFEPVIDKEKPDAVLVVGDVNSTIACALVAVKKNTRVIHVEAGLRSFDKTMPEEINRILTDQISDLLFTTERDAEKNLLDEGISREKIHFVGNVMIDTLYYALQKIDDESITLEKQKIALPKNKKEYGLITLHRPSNVDDPKKLSELLITLNRISKHLPLVFPLHPRTSKKIKDYKLNKLLDKENIIAINPMGYMELLGLMRNARIVLTDSGGIQEETTALGIPCITLRNTTERPITLTQGTNILAGTDKDMILKAADEILLNGGRTGQIPEAWDGKAAERIVEVLKSWL